MKRKMIKRKLKSLLFLALPKSVNFISALPVVLVYVPSYCTYTRNLNSNQELTWTIQKLTESYTSIIRIKHQFKILQ